MRSVVCEWNGLSPLSLWSGGGCKAVCSAEGVKKEGGDRIRVSGRSDDRDDFRLRRHLACLTRRLEPIDDRCLASGVTHN